MKRCKHCHHEKPLSAFYGDKAARDGLRPECKACTAARRKQWYAVNKEREIARVKGWQQENAERLNTYRRQRRTNPAVKQRDRANYLKRKYGMTLEDYDRLLVEQGGGCAICGRPPRDDIALHVDHDHETGRVRGLLCFPCNNTLGDFGDDPIRLYVAAAYLARDPEVDQLIRERVQMLAASGVGH